MSHNYFKGFVDFLFHAILWILVLWALFVLIGQNVHCQENPPAAAGGIKAVEIVLPAATFIDWHSSAGLREVNPILGQSRARQAAIMGAQTALVLWSARRMERRGWTKLSKITPWIAAGMHITAAVLNHRTKNRHE